MPPNYKKIWFYSIKYCYWILEMRLASISIEQAWFQNQSIQQARDWLNQSCSTTSFRTFKAWITLTPSCWRELSTSTCSRSWTPDWHFSQARIKNKLSWIKNRLRQRSKVKSWHLTSDFLLCLKLAWYCIAIDYSGDLNTGLVWYSNGILVSDYAMVCYWDQHLNNGLF